MSKMLSLDFDTNVKTINDLLHIDQSFDLMYRTIIIGGKRACFYFIGGFVNNDIMEKLMQFFYSVKPEDVELSLDDWTKRCLPYGQIEFYQDLDDCFKKLLSGVPCLLVEGYNAIIGIDFRAYPGRGVEEPEKDRVMRGSRDGFVEALAVNIALIRRRIRSRELVNEAYTVGTSSKTDVVICYMNKRVNHNFLDNIRKKIQNIQIDSLTMNQESLAECLYKGSWLNPFPKFKYTERPDATAAAILEGNIVIMVDNSPSAMILPSSIFDIMEEADDFYFPPLTGTYLKFSRFLINLAAWILAPTFLLFLMYPHWIPEWLSFIRIKDTQNIPVLLQFLILEFAIDGMKLASLNTPNMLSTPLSVVAGIVLGDFTVSSGWFNAEIMLYMAFITIANYSQANFELGYALKFMRMLCLITTGLFGIWGYLGGIIVVIILIANNQTISGKSYLYPLIPWNKRQFLHRFLRVSLPTSEKGQDYSK